MQSHFASKTGPISASFDESGERKSAGAGAASPTYAPMPAPTSNGPSLPWGCLGRSPISRGGSHCPTRRCNVAERRAKAKWTNMGGRLPGLSHSTIRWHLDSSWGEG